MKHSIILIFILAIGLQSSYSQGTSEKIGTFRANVLPQYNVYFSSADLTPAGQLSLTATGNYSSVSKESRMTLMNSIVKSWQESLIIIQDGTKRELWGLNNDTGRAYLIDAWDIDKKPAAAKPPVIQSNIARHPWFMYGGFQDQLDSRKNINMGINLRTGFFMLRDRWDLAASASGFMTGNLDSEGGNFQYNLGLSSKVYFPIKKYKVSPNIGGEVAWTNYSMEETSITSVSPFLLAGISWYVGNGSFDLGVRAGKQAVVLIGYTFIPRLNAAK